MQNKIIYWTYDTILEEALKFTTRNEFCNNSSAYQSALKKGILDEVCSHMNNKHEKWDINKVKNISINYITRYEFQRKEKCAYSYAHRNGVLEEVCSHMKINDTRFKPSKPAILYYIKIENDKTNPIYKIGITNAPVKDRITRMKISNEYNVTIVKEFHFTLGKSAHIVEKLLHEKFKKFKYKGNKIMDNGNTELYIMDVLSLGGLYV